MQKLQANNILGVDLSNHQGTVDFSTFKAQGIQFVFVKATEGTTFKDGYFSSNVSKAKAAGIPVGAYHFAHPDTNTPEAEANNFLSVITGKGLELSPVLDLEAGQMDTNAMISWVKKYRSIVETATGMKVILYTGKWFADRFNGWNGALADMPLWYANYVKGDITTAVLPDFGGWTDWTIWQYTDGGSLKGTNGYVDLNYARSLDALRQRVTPVKTYNLTQAEVVKTYIDGKPINGWDSGIKVDGQTHLIWTALNVLGVPNEFKGDGLFVINGEQVQGYVYNGNTYLPWAKIGKKLYPVQIDGGVNFMTTAPQPTDWRVDVGTQSIDYLVSQGILMADSADEWKGKLLQPAENWMIFLLLNRLAKKVIK